MATVKQLFKAAEDETTAEEKAAEILEEWAATPASLARRLSRGTWESVPHLIYLSNEIAQVAARPTFLILTEPPRHGKSELVSHWTPVWFLKKFPWKRIILASYEMGFASEWGGVAKDTIVENAEELGMELTKDTKAKGRWRLRGYGGGMSVSGIGGPITGRGADLFIIDDPIKNPEEALSLTYRERIYRWYQSVVRTRLEPGASVIIVMTRWHEDDLVGRLTTVPEGEEAIGAEVPRDPWKIINLPAIARKDDVLGRKEGEALWPDRFDLNALAKIRMALGPFWYSALYDGNPQPEGGGIIKEAWLKYYTEDTKPAKFSTIVQIWDTAFKEKQAADRSVCLTLGKAAEGFYALDLYVGRIDFPTLVRQSTIQFDKWAPSRVLIEDKASGISLLQQLRRDTLVPIRAIKIESGDDKVTRAHSVTGIIEAGKFFLPVGAPWLADFIYEVTNFPKARHDDITDVLVHGLRALKARLKMGQTGVIGETKESFTKTLA